MSYEPIIVHVMSGRRVDLRNLDPRDIRLDEICTRLSRLCRFTGAMPWFYSVARHSMNLARYFDYDIAEGDTSAALDRSNGMCAALMHDMAEAYIGDLIQPIKHAICPGFVRLERTVLDSIVSVLCPTVTFDMLGDSHAALMHAELETIKAPPLTACGCDLWDGKAMEETAAEMYRACRAVGIAEHG